MHLTASLLTRDFLSNHWSAMMMYVHSMPTKTSPRRATRGRRRCARREAGAARGRIISLRRISTIDVKTVHIQSCRHGRPIQSFHAARDMHQFAFDASPQQYSRMLRAIAHPLFCCLRPALPEGFVWSFPLLPWRPHFRNMRRTELV